MQNYQKIKLARFKNGVDISGLKPIDTICDNYPKFILTGSYHNARLNILDYFLKNLCILDKINETYITINNCILGGSFAINCSHKTGDILLDGDYQLYDRKGIRLM